MPPMTHLLRSGTLGLLALAAFAAEPAPAVITKLSDKSGGGAFDKSFVTAETIDGIEFLVDDPKGNNRLTLNRGTYQVTYDRTRDVDYLRGERTEESDPAKALPLYQKAVASDRLFWSKEDGLVAMARIQVHLKQWDGAIAAADQLAKEAPKSLRLDDILLLKGQAQQGKGDIAGAKATFTALAAMAKDWGESALVAGQRGLAGLLAADKKPGEAATALMPLVARVDPTTDGEAYGTLLLDLAGYQQASGQLDAAIASLSKAAYAPIDANAEAHLRWGRLLGEKTDLANTQAAFDHAAIAATLRGAPAPIQDQARILARQMVERLLKEPGLTDVQKLEYRQCRDRL